VRKNISSFLRKREKENREKARQRPPSKKNQPSLMKILDGGITENDKLLGPRERKRRRKVVLNLPEELGHRIRLTHSNSSRPRVTPVEHLQKNLKHNARLQNRVGGGVDRTRKEPYRRGKHFYSRDQEASTVRGQVWGENGKPAGVPGVEEKGFEVKGRQTIFYHNRTGTWGRKYCFHACKSVGSAH